MEEIFVTLADLPRNGRVILYGSGAAALTVLGRIRAERPDVTVPWLLDSFTEGKAGGLKVVKRTDLSSLAGEYDFILVASAWWRDIARSLEADNLPAWGVATPVLWHKYLFSDEELRRAKPKLDAVEALLATDEDRAVYRFLVECRRENSPLVSMDGMSPEIVDYLEVRQTLFSHLTGQYLDFVARDRIGTMLHAGVFDGTDCLRFLETFPHLEALHGFEPQGTARIRPETLAAIERSGRVHIHEKGLWDESRTIPLTGTGPYTTLTPDASPDAATGQVKTVSVDGFVAEQEIQRVDYLCLDVEGAEERVLDGARHTIENHRPQLAVCIYHKKEDIFRLPLALDDMLTDYVFHVGHYFNFLNETVLYALPAELVD